MTHHFKAWAQQIPQPNAKNIADTQTQLRALAMPQWALGELMDLAVQLAGCGDGGVISRPQCYVFGADHGVVDEGVAAYPAQVTSLMLQTMAKGRATINSLAQASAAEVFVIDMGSLGDHDHIFDDRHVLDRRIAKGSANLAHEAAMTEKQTLDAMEVGYLLAKDSKGDILGCGEMGIGNTTAATAIACALLGADPSKLSGPGAGLDQQGVSHKAAVIESALGLHPSRDPFDILRCLGGFEIAAMAGFAIGSASRGCPILMDGLISTAACALAAAMVEEVKPYLFASHCGAEVAHGSLLDHLQKKPLLKLGLRLGEGSGAALAMPLVMSASRLVKDVASLDEVLG